MINFSRCTQQSIITVGLFLSILTIQTGFAQTGSTWVEQSNEHTKVLLDIISKYNPESAAAFGVEGFDDQIIDLSPGFNDRNVQDLKEARAYLKSELDKGGDDAVEQDLRILIESCDNDIEEIHLNEVNLLPYYNTSRIIYNGISSLLEDRIPAERREAALSRLKKYVGSEKGYTPLTELAREYMQKEWKTEGKRLAPYKQEVERDLSNSDEYIQEIGDLFEKYEIKGFEKDYKKLTEQIKTQQDYIQKEILPKARTDFKLPKDVYAFQLKEYGVDMPIDELQHRAMVAFKELQTQMQVLANIIAEKYNYPGNDYRDVLRTMKKEQLDSASILPYYRERIKEIEAIIKRENLLTLPDRDMVIRLASPAESAAVPAPFMSPPRLIGNTGEHGEFVLPLKTTGDGDPASLKIDDFTHEAAAWALIAHEGRPGHELQFTAMVERGVSQARIIFAFNSVNAEGWALYAEEILQPYFPVEGQFMTLWSRLVRAGRAFLDPGLNLGTISTEDARYILRNEIVLSEALVQSELDRYQFRAPGQATSYFNGYLRLMELRAETELILGKNFNQLAFHDFILSQGLLPPKLIKKAINEEFIPQYK